MRHVLGEALVVALMAAPAGALGAGKSMPTDAECGPLPATLTPAWKPGEELEYDIDVLTANAARMDVLALPPNRGELPIQVEVKTNTFFNKVRKVKATSKSLLSPRTLRPDHYQEDAWEDSEHKVAEVDFHGKTFPPHSVLIHYVTNPQAGGHYIDIYGKYAHDALDVLGAVFLVRSLDLKPGLKLCFDIYAMRHMWRVWGEIGDPEKVATKAGEFSAFHITGSAARLDTPAIGRDLDLWITNDDQRIPVGALGAIDLGPVRATLVHAGHTDDNEPRKSRIDEIPW